MKQGYQKFKHKLWISVTELDDVSGDTGKFIFDFNEPFIRSFIEKLKKTPGLAYSPLILVSQLISKIINDEQTGKYKQGIYTFQESLDYLKVRSLDETYIFWIAERILYSEFNRTAIGVHTIVQKERYLLSLDHSAFNHEIVLKIIEPIRQQIFDIFSQNLTEYKKSRFAKLYFKYSDALKTTVVVSSGKVKNVFVDESIKQAIVDPIINGIKEYILKGF